MHGHRTVDTSFKNRETLFTYPKNHIYLKYVVFIFNLAYTIYMKISFKFIVSIVCVVLALILVALSFTIISPTQRGIMITLGKSGDTVLTPGLNAHIPLVQRVAKYDLAPKNIDLNFTPGQDAAVTLDMQSVACSMSVYWTYDESRLIDAVTRYSSASIKSLIEKNSLGAIKEVVGEYSIYDIVEKQGEVTSKVYTSLSNRLKDCPVIITNVTIGNWDWSAEFDAQIAATMAMTQQSKIAEQELAVTKQQVQKQVAEAEAAKQKAEIEAQMKVTVAEQAALAREAEAKGLANAQKIAAEGEAEAKKIEADAEAYARQKEGEAEASYYSSLEPYMNTVEMMRELDISKVRAELWNGVEVSTYIPLTASGAVVTIPGE